MHSRFYHVKICALILKKVREAYNCVTSKCCEEAVFVRTYLADILIFALNITKIWGKNYPCQFYFSFFPQLKIAGATAV